MPRFRPLLWPTVLAVPALAILLALGWWQLERLAWKENLIAMAEGRSAMAPVALPDPQAWDTLDAGAWAYRPVRTEGVFEHDAEAYVFTALGDPKGPLGGSGYLVMTPLRLAGGAVVLVNRGFVPLTMKDPSSRPEGQITGPVTVAGLMRFPERAGWFVPEPERAEGVWYSRDIVSIGAARGLAGLAPFYIDEGVRSGVPVPQGGETRVTFRNPHLGYALTWFGLAAALLVVYLAFHHAHGRLGRGQ